MILTIIGRYGTIWQKRVNNHFMDKSLINMEVSRKLKGILDEINICIFNTSDFLKRRIVSGLMSTARVDEDSTLWFFTEKNSKQVMDIEANRAVHLVFSHPAKSNFVDIWGQAILIEDRIKIDELWSPVAHVLFLNGKPKSDICLIKVKPQKAYYWDGDINQSVGYLTSQFPTPTDT